MTKGAGLFCLLLAAAPEYDVGLAGLVWGTNHGPTAPSEQIGKTVLKNCLFLFPKHSSLILRRHQITLKGLRVQGRRLLVHRRPSLPL